MLRTAIATCLAAAVLMPAEAAADERALSTAAIIAKLNRERAALGVYSAVTEDAARTEGCRLHNRWMR